MTLNRSRTEITNSPALTPKAPEIDTSYKLDFYDAYAAYLQERRVRQVHDRLLSFVTLDPAFKKVIDLGEVAKPVRLYT